MTTDNLWKETPLIYSSKLSDRTGADVFLKLETVHPSHSFKYRGISHFISKALSQHQHQHHQNQNQNHHSNPNDPPKIHIVAASGGNAGLAAACAAKSLALPCTIFLPARATGNAAELLKREGANVVIGGEVYREALDKAEGFVERNPDAVMVPAYDHPDVWEGHSSMVHELEKQLPRKPTAIFCSVGGAGLLGGIMVGCKAVGWDDVTLGAMGTKGSDCFLESMALNRGHTDPTQRTLPSGVHLVRNEAHQVNLAHFTKFSSLASGSLGASEPSAAILKMALDREGKVKTVSVDDEMSIGALKEFADDHKLLVELSCSTALVPAYHPELFHKIVEGEKDGEKPVVVFIVCGGFKIDLKTIAAYEEVLLNSARSGEQSWTVKYDNGLFTFKK